MSAYETFASVYDLFMEQVEYDEWLDHIHAVWKKYAAGQAVFCFLWRRRASM